MPGGAPLPPPTRGREDSDRPPPTARLPIDPDKATFVTLHAKGQTRLSNVNGFIIKKVIDGNVGNVINVKKLASGDLLIHTLNSSQVKSLMKLRYIHDIEVEASIPVSMNSCRGVASHYDFVDMETADIVDNMADQNVIEARKITKMVDGVRRNTAAVIFTFATSKLPERVMVGYESAPLRPFIPNPLRCFKCQLYGHHGNACRSSLSYCGKCAGEGHRSDDCTSLVEKCRNCTGAHSTFSRDCPAWKLEKEVCTIKANEGISYLEARKRVKATQSAPSPNASYATSVQKRPVMCTIAVQTDPLPAASATATSTSTTAATPTTQTPSTSNTNYSTAVSTTPESKKEKPDKRDKLNYTKLERQRPSHVSATPAPSRKGSHARSLSSSSGELVIDEAMEASGRKDRERSPGSDTARKRTKKSGRPRYS